MEPLQAATPEPLPPQGILRRLLGLRGLPPEIAKGILEALGEDGRPALPEALLVRRAWGYVETLCRLGLVVEAKADRPEQLFFAVEGTSLFRFSMRPPDWKLSIKLRCFRAAHWVAPPDVMHSVIGCYREFIWKDAAPLVLMTDVEKLLKRITLQVTGADHVTMYYPQPRIERRGDAPISAEPYDPELVEREALGRGCLVAVEHVTTNSSQRSKWGGPWKSVAMMPIGLPLEAPESLEWVVVHAWSADPEWWTDDRLAAFAVLGGAVPSLLRHLHALRQIAYMDEDVPDLFNPRYWKLVFPLAVRRPPPPESALACCFVDVNDLKDKNASRRGYLAGNEVIEHVGRTLVKEVARHWTQWVARRGRGDEFFFLLSGDRRHVEAFAKRVPDIVWRKKDDTGYPTSISMGVVFFGDLDDRQKPICDEIGIAVAGDWALKRAKEDKNRNKGNESYKGKTVFYSPPDDDTGLDS